MHPYSLRKSIKVVNVLSRAYLRHFRKGTPLWGHLYVTRKCNLDCEYCFFKDSAKKDLGLDGIRKVLDRMRAMGVGFLAFHGGEPTIRRDFPEIVQHAHDLGFFTYLNTNGTLLDKEYIDRIGAAGIDVVNLSVDSIQTFAPSHKDLAHTKAALDQLIEARSRYKFEITANFVLNNQNTGILEETLDHLDRLGIPLSIGFIVKHPTCESQPESLFFESPEDRQKLFSVLERIVRWRREGRNIIEPEAYFRDIRKFVEGDLRWKCLAGKDSIGIDTLGELKFCGTLPSEGISIEDLDAETIRGLYGMRQEKYGQCQERCLTNCRYVTQYYYKHPFKFIREVASVRRRLFGSAKRPR